MYFSFSVRCRAFIGFIIVISRETNDPRLENNLYPFVFLNVDGTVFVFANNRAILLDYAKNVVVRTFPTM
ncbi:hypothetical protein VNO78_20909 [Psophocarpus tetragonolobus]|uniref:Glyoxal oxidase N-terminal domain-containing protein n=1 Tax=Psophocarpus tetragonolobus TaxID=3891 RepID=A0AAN9XHK1_PSOTE